MQPGPVMSPPPINNRSAAQLATGKPPLTLPGDALTKEQRQSIIDSFKSIPLKDLSPDALAFVKAEVKKLEAKLGKKLNIDFEKMTLNDIPGAGGKIAEALMMHVKKTNPVAFAGLVAAAAGGAGAVAYTQGSKGLDDLGVPTSVDGNVKGFDLKLGTTFESGFENLKVTGGAGRRFGDYGRVSVQATGSADGFEKGSASYKVGKDNSASVGVSTGDKGTTVSGGVTVKGGPVRAGANGSRNVTTGDEAGSVSVDVAVTDRVKVGAKASGSVKDGKSQGTVTGSVSYTGKNVDVVVSGKAGPGEKMIGVGVKVDLDRGAPAKKKTTKADARPGPEAGAVEKGAAQTTAAKLLPKGVDPSNGIDPEVLAGDLAMKVAQAVKDGKGSIELQLPKEYQKLDADQRKAIAAEIAKVAKAVAAEVPGASDVRSIKMSFGAKQNEYAALRD